MKSKITLLLLLCAIGLSAQQYSTRSKAAIKLYQQAGIARSWDEKLDLLNRAIQKDKMFSEAYYQLANAQANIDSFPAAVRTLETLYELRQEDGVRMRLAEAYYRNAQYSDAVETINGIESADLKARTAPLIERYRNALYLYTHPVDIKPRRLEGVNTKYNDYFPTITADGSMMSTTVLCPIADYAGNERDQEDLYVSFAKPNGGWTFARPMADINTPDNEGSQSFSADGRYMFLVSCNHPDNIGSCDIYYSIRRGNTWSTPMNIGAPVNTEYWESNPVMSPAGDEIFFVTNRPGGKGDRDIWHARLRILKNGRLEPYQVEPLPEPINTREADFAPFMHADGQTLYFSSMGHNGLGGADIFFSKRVNGVWSKPENLGYPINTNGEESGFTVNGEGSKAYYASDKINPELNTGLDIYEIDLPAAARPRKMLFSPGRVFDATTYKPVQAYVEIFDQTSCKNYFKSMSDKAAGDFVAFLPEDGTYGLTVKQEGYLFFTKEIAHPGDSILVALQPILAGNSMTMENLYFATDEDRILETSAAVIAQLTEFLRTNRTVKIRIEGHTDNKGSAAHNNDLSLRRANALKTALVAKGIAEGRITTAGLGSTRPVADNSTEEGRARNRRVEVVIM